MRVTSGSASRSPITGIRHWNIAWLFGVWGLGFGVWGLGFRALGSGCGVWGLGFLV